MVSSRYECKLKGLIFERYVKEDEQNEVADGVRKQEGGRTEADVVEGKGLVSVSLDCSPKQNLIEGPECRWFIWEVSPVLHSEDMGRKRPGRRGSQQGRAVAELFTAVGSWNSMPWVTL